MNSSFAIGRADQQAVSVLVQAGFQEVHLFEADRGWSEEYLGLAYVRGGGGYDAQAARAQLRCEPEHRRGFASAAHEGNDVSVFYAQGFRKRYHRAIIVFQLVVDSR